MGKFATVSEDAKRAAVDRYLGGASIDEVARYLPVGASTVRKWIHERAPGQMRTSQFAKKLSAKRVADDELAYPRWRETKENAMDTLAIEARWALGHFIPRPGQ